MKDLCCVEGTLVLYSDLGKREYMMGFAVCCCFGRNDDLFVGKFVLSNASDECSGWDGFEIHSF